MVEWVVVVVLFLISLVVVVDFVAISVHDDLLVGNLSASVVRCHTASWFTAIHYDI